MKYHNEINEFAAVLQEEGEKPRKDLQRVLDFFGVHKARELLEQARAIETAGGMWTNDGARRRTLGGVFFKLARERMPRTPPPKPVPRPSWSEAIRAAETASFVRGEAHIVKITLIGRPGTIVKRDSVVVVTMYNNKRPPLPKQLPRLSGSDVDTPYTIFIALKQWRKISESLNDPADALIIEGYPFLDPGVRGICVFAKSITTKLIQREQRQRVQAD